MGRFGSVIKRLTKWDAVTRTSLFIGAVIAIGSPLWSRIEAIATWDATIILPEDDH